MARPKRALRNRQVLVRLTAENHALLTKAATSRGLTVTAYVTSAAIVAATEQMEKK